MATANGEYRLSAQLLGHEDDVRGICICGDAGIATSSRDCTVRFWTRDPIHNSKYTLSRTLVGHSSFVGPLAWVPPREGLPQGGIVSGGMDMLVLLWDLASGEVVETMRGHKSQVTGVAVGDDGDVFSSSMDCTIKQWRKGQLIESWEAHKVAVQAVQKLPSGELITASSDASLKLWKGKTCVHTFKGHTDTVRDVAVMPGLGILSASHDCSVRLWALTGQVLLEMIGHASLVYSVDGHSTGHIASGSEDYFLKIWRDGICLQSIEHPGCVWDVKFLGSGDIVTGCSDGVARIWTSSNERLIDPAELEAYESLLHQYKLSRKKVGGLSLSELPGLEALQVPGSKEGQTLIIREGDCGVAYSWNSKEQKWDKIGEVVDGPEGSSNRPVLNGVQYDYVFDVDIGDGEPIRKLPYNRADNPYTTADSWLLKENLPLSYREQVVQFILQNTGQKDFSVDTSFRDPYTGANAYVPGQSSGPSVTAKKPTLKHLPKKGFLFFDTLQFDGILKKMGEFNNTLSLDPVQKHLSLTELEFSRLTVIINILKDSSHYHTSTFADADIDLLSNLLKSWPSDMVFPVIDTMRMLILHPDGSNLLHKYAKQDNDVVMGVFRKVTTSPVSPANLLTITRAVSNLFRHSYFHEWLLINCSEILDKLSCCRSSFNKNLHISYSTLVLNFAVLLIDRKDQQGQAQVLSAAMEIAEDEKQDTDSRFRALVAVGSLMIDGLVKAIAIDFDVRAIAKAAKSSKEKKVAEVGADIECLINSS